MLLAEQLYSKFIYTYNYVEFSTSREPIMIESRRILLNKLIITNNKTFYFS